MSPLPAPPPSETAAPLGAERAARLWTPERVPLTVPLAGLGERALAYGIDLGVVVLALFVLFFIYNFWGDLEADLGALSPVGTLALALFGFGSVVLYDTLFEVLGDGRTPGKRLMKLRVVSAGGRTPDLATSLLRNALRLLDWLPFFYGVGTVALFVTGTRRVGDLLANTVIVTERAREVDPFAPCVEAAATLGAWPQPRPWSDAQLLQALEIVERTRELPAPAADKLCRRVLARIDDELAGDESVTSARVALARVCLALRDVRGGMGAQITRCLTAERQLSSRLVAARARPSLEAVELLDDAIRHAASELMRGTRRGAPARVLEALSLTLLDAERHRAAVGARAGLWHLLAVEVPGAVYQERKQIARAGLVFTLSVVVGFSLAYANAALGKALVGEDLARLIEEGASWTNRIEEQGSFANAAVMIITNNVRVALIAFVMGLVGGVGPLLVLYGNGLHFGSVFGYAMSLGTAGTLGKFVLAHGPTELTAICVAGAAGMCLGRALIAPGRRTRLEALRAEAATGGKLALAAVLMLLVIGGVEGFVSPGSLFPWPVNLAVGVAMISLFVAWAVLLGRPAASRRVEPQ